MKNIMLIAIATLTIATANATNWKSVSPVQVVNNTNVTLEFRTEPGNDYFTVPAGQTVSGPNAGSYGTYIGWGINSSTDIGPVWAQDFDNSLAIFGGTLSTNTSTFYGNFYLGQVWAVGGIGYNDTLVITGTASGNMMQLTLTRERGVTVVRTDSTWTNGDVFCLDTGVEFELNEKNNSGTFNSGRCPVGETRVVLAEDDILLKYQWGIDAYDATGLITNIIDAYDYATLSYTKKPSNLLYGVYTNGFATLPYDNINNTHIEVYLNGDPNPPNPPS